MIYLKDKCLIIGKDFKMNEIEENEKIILLKILETVSFELDKLHEIYDEKICCDIINKLLDTYSYFKHMN